MSTWLVMVLVWLGASVLVAPVIGSVLKAHAPQPPLVPKLWAVRPRVVGLTPAVRDRTLVQGPISGAVSSGPRYTWADRWLSTAGCPARPARPGLVPSVPIITSFSSRSISGRPPVTGGRTSR